MTSNTEMPGWARALLADEAASAAAGGDDGAFIMDGPILRSRALHTASQQQTSDMFGFKWQKRDTFESDTARRVIREWSLERYGQPGEWFADMDRPVVVDAGCGAAYTGLEYFGSVLDRIRYVGVDISAAIDVAHDRMTKAGADCAFIQSDLNKIPLKLDSVDVIFSEGVLHHTDSTKAALGALVPLVRRGGLLMFYVYVKKGPIREFTDDYIRERMQGMSGEEGWAAMMPLTKLGKTLGELDIEIEIDEPIDLLEIPAGKHNLQRLFYWHIFKAFYRPDYSLEEMNHLNFDWYAPKNAHRQTKEEVRAWCDELGLEILHENIDQPGLTYVTRKKG